MRVRFQASPKTLRLGRARRRQHIHASQQMGTRSHGRLAIVHVVMAYIVMACVVMAYGVCMAYIVTAYIGIAYIDMAYTAMAHIVYGLYSYGRCNRWVPLSLVADIHTHL